MTATLRLRWRFVGDRLAFGEALHDALGFGRVVSVVLLRSALEFLKLAPWGFQSVLRRHGGNLQVGDSTTDRACQGGVL